MIHPNIFEMIRITRDARNPNRHVDQRDAARRAAPDMLLDSGLDYVILAFDGASKETYEKYRFGATFEKTRENILNFLQRKLDRKSPIYVVLQMVMLKENSHEVQAYRSSGPFRVWMKSASSATKCRSMVRKFPAVSRRPAPQPVPPAMARPSYVRYDGPRLSVLLYVRRETLGDLKKQSVMEVWNSPGMVQLREAHLTGDLSQYPSLPDLSGSTSQPRGHVRQPHAE